MSHACKFRRLRYGGWILTFVACATSADFEAGRKAYTDYNYAAALAEWQPLAEQGDARAQYEVGALHHYGRGVPKNPAKAAAWYRKAASQGHELAKKNLARLEAGAVAQAPKNSARPSSPYPSAPAPRDGYVTCKTNCMNGDCYRTYSNGERVHFQAKRKFDSFSGNWEWDAGGC